ncbi:MAG: tRNA uridine-5-carboxymethylaminomethyl(34) synthesis GTPase MnmE [Gammaproteobacteria bacterium]|nr:tRNA uridine-5-carboxymethylaminomethyl(34) synthesis GTPase MnmE [Gammaproteobacteria bacterium]MYF61871.1 tRNA uridine-5-carboxymethylaminomethyl(34) synthesis GTPase MnmE [Gammaproteobacteria bacterium]MYI23688.1 tRNA uridine-5-carboxymethylaminomethyl(34) synthesis GTPase MnmE [Gammaproteobacteria bacterium]
MVQGAGLTDTIVAAATPPGPGALAVVRISGPSAFSVKRALAPDLRAPADRRAMLAGLHDPETGELLDRGIVTSYPAPASYTGEDMVEISCHGGYLIPGLLVEHAIEAGARMAEPGEFTRRAYLNGKMDLLQAEAVCDLVGGRSRALHRVAVHQMERGLSARMTAARESLVTLEALLVHHLDFPDEDEPPTSLGSVAGEAREVRLRLEGVLATAPEGELLREGALTVLAGRPNSGKSSIFNALVGYERAIVTEVPGTTRDALEATVSLSGYPFRLVDTAGLRETGERVEALGIEVARRYLARADLVLYCAEGSEGVSEVDLEFLGACDCPFLVLETKADLARQGNGASREYVDAGEALPRRIATSVVTGEGLEELGRVLPGMVFGGLVQANADTPVVTRRRHRRALERAVGELNAFERALADGIPAEVAATHLRPAETALEDILGIVTLDEVLDRVFRDFCIGK